MIAFVRGTVVELSENSIILESGNIGYEIYMPGSTIERMIRVKEEIKVHTYFHVREEVMQLYGFLSKDDLRMFRMLLGVNGIGPKAALGILSAITPDELRFAVLADDIKTVSKAPGVGKKTAQKLILELKDKLDLEEALTLKMEHAQENVGVELQNEKQDGRAEAVEALVALGYSHAQALRAVRDISGVETHDVEEILKAALKNL